MDCILFYKVFGWTNGVVIQAWPKNLDNRKYNPPQFQSLTCQAIKFSTFISHQEIAFDGDCFCLYIHFMFKA